jgi:heptosyltransferase-1
LSKKNAFAGFDRSSAREGGASFFYSEKWKVLANIHAITRTRLLCSKIFGYELSPVDLKIPSYGLVLSQDYLRPAPPRPYVVFLHGTTWETKHWPVAYWVELAQKITAHGLDVMLSFGNSVEKNRAEAIQQSVKSSSGQVVILPKSSLSEIARVLKGSAYVVGVDTGLAHLSAAMECQSLILFGPTDTSLTGPLSQTQESLQSTFACSPCFEKQCRYPSKAEFSLQPPCFVELSPDVVWSKIAQSLAKREANPT